MEKRIDTDDLNGIPRAVKNNIYEYTPILPVLAYRNCGEFYAMLPPFPLGGRIQHLRNPHRMQTMKELVMRTVQWFLQRLLNLEWIKEFSLSPTYKESVLKRVLQAVSNVRAIDVQALTTITDADAAARTLVHTCREILAWRQECTRIYERIELMFNDTKRRIISPEEAHPTIPDFPDKLWTKHDTNSPHGFNSPRYWKRMMRDCYPPSSLRQYGLLGFLRLLERPTQND